MIDYSTHTSGGAITVTIGEGITVGEFQRRARRYVQCLDQTQLAIAYIEKAELDTRCSRAAYVATMDQQQSALLDLLEAAHQLK
jgi:hypothetical protein